MSRVLSVGQCGPDHAAISRLLRNQFKAEVVTADSAAEAFDLLRQGPFALVLVNRKLDLDYTDGLAIIEQMKADPALSATPAMLVTNYPEHQATAIAAGAEPGFGKQELARPETAAKLAKFLGPPA